MRGMRTMDRLDIEHRPVWIEQVDRAGFALEQPAALRQDGLEDLVERPTTGVDGREQVAQDLGDLPPSVYLAGALGDAQLQNLIGVDLLGDVAHHAEQREPALIHEAPTKHFDVEDAAIAADVLRPAAVLLTLAHFAEVLGEQVVAVRMDKRGRMQANHPLVPVHAAKRRIGLDHQSRLGVVDHQTVAAGLENGPIFGLLLTNRLDLGGHCRPSLLGERGESGTWPPCQAMFPLAGWRPAGGRLSFWAHDFHTLSRTFPVVHVAAHAWHQRPEGLVTSRETQNRPRV